MTTTPWHRGDPDQALRTLLAVFDLGQLFNQVSWYLGQDIMYFKKTYEKQFVDALNELVARAIEAMPNPEAGMQIRDAVMEFHAVRQKVENAEYHAEDVSAAFERLREEATGDCESSLRWDILEDELKPITKQIEELLEIIRVPLRSKLATVPEVWAAFLLGECVDQGLRPPGVLHHLFWQGTSRKWLKAVRESPRARWRPKSDPSSPSTIVTYHLPPRYTLAVRKYHPGDLPPPLGWAETIKGLWQNLRIQAELPKSLFLLAGRPQLLGVRGVVERIKRAAREGFVRQSDGLKAPELINTTRMQLGHLFCLSRIWKNAPFGLA